MMQFEMKMSAITEERERRSELDRLKDAKRRRAKDKRAKAIAEERRLKDLRRLAMEDAEEELRTANAKQAFARERAFQVFTRALPPSPPPSSLSFSLARSLSLALLSRAFLVLAPRLIPALLTDAAP